MRSKCKRDLTNPDLKPSKIAPDVRSHLMNTRSGVLLGISSELEWDQILKGAGAVDLLTGHIVVPRVDFPSPAIQLPTRDVRFAAKQSARCEDAPCVTPRIRPKSLAAPSAPIYEDDFYFLKLG